MPAQWPFIFLLYLLPCKEQATADSIVKVNAPEVTAYAGKSGEIHIYVTIKKGYHVQANKVNDDFMIPTTLEINTGEIITTGKQSFNFRATWVYQLTRADKTVKRDTGYSIMTKDFKLISNEDYVAELN